MSNELWNKSAIELAGLIRDKEASSREVVEAHLDRIDSVNPDLNAVVVVLAERAREEADAADAVTTSGEEIGPLHGVPMTVKENLDLVGSPTTQGMPAFADAMPTQDAPAVERMRRAGAIPIGRTNLPEMGLRISTDNPLRGLTRNPWNPDVTAGGSSGGEASAIAARMSPIGIGNDIGGSLRNPAFCCGIASIKPTHGRVPMGSSIEPIDPPLASAIMATDGPMARTIADVRLGLQIMSGQHVRDPRSVTVPFDSGHLANDSGHLAKRVALVTSIPGGSVRPQYIEAVRAAGRALEAQGYESEEVEVPELERVNEVWGRLLSASVANLIPLFDGIMDPQTFRTLQDFVSRFAQPGPIDILTAERNRLGRVWSAFLADYPVVVSPVWTNPAFPHGVDIAEGGIDLTLDRIRMITPGNLLGLPAAVVTTGLGEGMPEAVQVMADRFSDDRALNAAEIVESASERIHPELGG